MDEAQKLRRQADHAEWLGGIALFEAARSEDCDHDYRHEAKRHHAEAERLRWAAMEIETGAKP